MNMVNNSKNRPPPSPVPIPPPSERSFAPQVRIVNGEIVLDEESLTIAAEEGGTGVEEYNVVLETGNHVTSASYTNRAYILFTN